MNEYEEGGIKMVDLECMVKSVRLAWLKRIFSGTNGTWKSYLQHILSSVGGSFFFNCNYNITDYTLFLLNFIGNFCYGGRNFVKRLPLKKIGKPQSGITKK